MFAERSLLSCLYNTLIFMQLLYVTRSFGVIYDEYVVDQGKNLTLQCKSPYPVMWVHAGRRDGDFQQFQNDGSLQLTNLTAKDGGLYTCSEMVPTFTTVQLSSESLPEDDSDNSTVDSGFVIFSTVARNESSNSSSEDLPAASTPQFDSTPDRYVELRRVHVKVRTSPLAVSNFFRASVNYYCGAGVGSAAKPDRRIRDPGFYGGNATAPDDGGGPGGTLGDDRPEAH
uniref:(northern house mosquito) hypothetical protein n=1 Tax=Culex pipiens TaxID=7175 RepID=A0A8D8JQR1_CULPI